MVHSTDAHYICGFRTAAGDSGVFLCCHCSRCHFRAAYYESAEAGIIERVDGSWQRPIEEIITMEMPKITPERCDLLAAGIVKSELGLVVHFECIQA